MNDLEQVYKIFDYQFKDTELLKLALTHRSIGSHN
ncbi:MAG: ribonuclease III, partial [Gammaproteobacteria bacterium]|nr:ribonuclease III [Gammaproteobacteria bacterium]